MLIFIRVLFCHMCLLSHEKDNGSDYGFDTQAGRLFTQINVFGATANQRAALAMCVFTPHFCKIL